MLFVLAFCLGAVVGSFLNVCIWRLPAGESIVYPASHCPRCHVPILIRDNVPIFSYLFLRGRCRNCQTPISVRYPLVELLTGGMFVLLLYRFDLSPIFAASAVFVSALIAISFIDLDHQIIPDVISLPGIVVGLLLAVFGFGPPILDAVLGVLLGGGLLYGVAVGYHLLTGREGMGGGDIKLLAMIGAFLGWSGVLVTLVLGSFTGAVLGIGLILARGADTRLPIPFGPFLAFGALCALFFGDPLIHWYMHLAFAA